MARTIRHHVQGHSNQSQSNKFRLKETHGASVGTQGRHGTGDGHVDQSALSSPRQPGDRAHLDKLSNMMLKLHRVQSLVEQSQRPFSPAEGASATVSTGSKARRDTGTEHRGEEQATSICDGQSSLSTEESSISAADRAGRMKHEPCTSLISFNHSLRAWLEGSDHSKPPPQRPPDAVTDRTVPSVHSSPSKATGIAATATSAAAAAHACPSPPVPTSNTQACAVAEDVDLFYLPPPPHHVSTGDLWSEGTLEDTTLSTQCSSATLTTSPQPVMITSRVSRPSGDGDTPSRGRETCSEVALQLGSVAESGNVNTMQNDEAASERTEASEVPTPREQLAQTQKLLEDLQGSLRKKQKLLEDLGRMRARKRALEITECVSQRQRLQNEVNQVELLVAMLEDHERELSAQRSLCHARIRASTAINASQSTRGLCKEPSILSDSTNSHVYDEVHASCGGVWHGAKILAKSLKQKSKRMHARAAAAGSQQSDDRSTHDAHESQHGSPEDSGVFVAAMECTEKLPSSRSLSVANFTARQFKTSEEEPSRETSLELMSPSPSMRPPRATADMAAGSMYACSREQNALESSGRFSRSTRASIRKLGHLATKLKNATDKALRGTHLSSSCTGSDHSVQRDNMNITQGSVEDCDVANVFQAHEVHQEPSDDRTARSQYNSYDQNCALHLQEGVNMAMLPANPTPPPANGSRLSLFGAYAQSSLATDTSNADRADSQEIDTPAMHAPHACPSATSLQPLVIPPPSVDAEGSAEISGRDSARIGPCWSASELSGPVPERSPEQNGLAPTNPPMHDSMRVARCSITRTRLPVPPLHAPHACSSEPKNTSGSRQQVHDSHASRFLRKGKFWSMAVRAVMRSESGRNSSNTENKFASRDHARLHQVESSLSTVSEQLHEQREKLKRLRKELAGVISTLDTLVISQSVSQQLLEQARMNKVQRLCRKHGEPHIKHGKHTCGTSEAVKASIEAGKLMEELMHDTEVELVRVKEMTWQQCMDFEWGVRPLVDTSTGPPQRIHGMRVVKWRAQATKLVRGLFRGKAKKDVAVPDQSISQKFPHVDVTAERCKDHQRSRMLRMTGMNRQQG